MQRTQDGRFVLAEGHPFEPVVRVVACDHCGFCFNDKRSTREDYDRHYREISKYADPKLSRGSGSSPEDTRRLAETTSVIREFAGATGGSILDIGCGAGGLLDSLATLGFTALVGMDPAAEVTRRGHRDIVGTLDDHPLGGDRLFDGIVLSHVRDVRAALAGVRRLLAADGWLYVEVPDVARYGECLIVPHQDFNLEHINHFSAGSLQNLLAAHGWRVAREAAKTLDLGHGLGYPADFALAHPAPAAIEPDLTARHTLAAYLTASALRMEAIERVLASEVQAGPIVVWGARQFMMRLLGETSLGQGRHHRLRRFKPRPSRPHARRPTDPRAVRTARPRHCSYPDRDRFARESRVDRSRDSRSRPCQPGCSHYGCGSAVNRAADAIEMLFPSKVGRHLFMPNRRGSHGCGEAETMTPQKRS